jgi:hypothetical protein
LVATTARSCLVCIVHRADSLAAGAVSCRLMSSTFTEFLPRSLRGAAFVLRVRRSSKSEGGLQATADKPGQVLVVQS